jgi:nickel transport protein
MKHIYSNSRSFPVSCRKQLIRVFAVLLGILLSVCTLANSADAHKVNIFAYAQDGKVHAEGYFVDGSKCKNSLISVIDEKTGEKLLEGRTDENGQYSFDITRVTSLKLILHAGTGHQNEYVLTEQEVSEAMPAAKKKMEKKVEQKDRAAPEPRPIKSEQPAGLQNAINPPTSSEDLEAVVGKVVDSKLQPVMRTLVKLQEQSEKPGLTEIIGGIGYIIGIIGIIGYLKSRAARRNSRSQ